MKYTTETFFRPDEVSRERVNLPAPLFNRCKLLLNRSALGNVFIPVRTMQYQAVIDSDEIIFVDNQGYAVQDSKGGRLIVLSWEVALHGPRDSLNKPVPIDVVYYGPERHETHRRLMGEFPKAIDIYESRLKENSNPGKTATVLSFKT
jgi:hypothetical protein